MLEEEGEAVPAKRGRNSGSGKKQPGGDEDDEDDEGGMGGDGRNEGESGGERGIGSIGSGLADEDSEGEEGGFFFEGVAPPSKSASEDISNHDENPPTNSASSKKDPEVARRRPMTYGDRAALIKARKQEKKAARDTYVEKRRVEHERREGLRQTHKRQMTKYTSRGQPKMGPRINRLLDKIKETSIS